MNRDLKKERRDYALATLLESQCPPEPMALFDEWMKDALERALPDATCFHLGTVNEEAFPEVRVVLLKEYGPEGLVFYTNYQSAKGRQLEQNPRVSLNFYWHSLERQVRIQGTVEKVSPETSDAYFAERPRESQLAAAVSEQSRTVESREVLEARLQALEKKLAGRAVPRPENWGGYLVRPVRFHFWQGRPGRLHDRIQYRRNGEQWLMQRLQP